MKRLANLFRFSCLFLILAAPVARAQKDPHIGYLYPAGGRQGTTFEVTVDEGVSHTTHRVTVSDDVAAKYAPGQPVERLLEASFEFLLEREPKESILSAFDLPVIERYFPEYPRVVKDKI